MSNQSFEEALTVQAAAGTSFGSYTTAKTVINAAQLITWPPNYWQVGKSMKVTVLGGIGTLVTTPGTITFQVMIGSVVVWTSGAIQMNATAHTDLPFILEVWLTCRAIGSGTSANFMGQGRVGGIMFTLTAAQIDEVNAPGIFPAPATTPAVGTGFDSTTAQIQDFFVGLSVNNAANTVTVDQYIVEVLN